MQIVYLDKNISVEKLFLETNFWNQIKFKIILYYSSYVTFRGF